MEEIFELIKNKIGVNNITENSENENDLGCTGDDFSELMEEYSQKFNVDMSNYIWYFHHYEEGYNSTWELFGYKSPPNTVKQIPVTPKMLYEFSKTGKYNIEYPEHKLPDNRFANIVNRILFYCFIVGLIIFIWRKIL